MSAFMGQHGDWLDRHVDAWEREGIVSHDQAGAIRHFEHLDEVDEPERLTIGAEVVSYLGSVLALMGGALVVSRRWDELGVAGQLGIAAAIAVVGLLAGAWLMRQGEAGTDRLGGFMWGIGAGGIAMFVGLATDRYGPDGEEWPPIVIGLALLAVGIGLWRNLDRPLQFLTTAVGFGVLTAGIGVRYEPPAWVASIVFMSVGAVVAVLAAVDALRPRLLALATGSCSAFVGAFALSDVNEHIGPIVALAVATFVIVFALVDRTIPLLVLGVIGALMSTQVLLQTTFDSASSSGIVALIGLAVVVLALGRLRRPHDAERGTAA